MRYRVVAVERLGFPTAYEVEYKSWFWGWTNIALRTPSSSLRYSYRYYDEKKAYEVFRFLISKKERTVVWEAEV